MKGLLVQTQGVEAVGGEGVQSAHPSLFLELPACAVLTAFEDSEREVREAAKACEVLSDTVWGAVKNAINMLGNASA